MIRQIMHSELIGTAWLILRFHSDFHLRVLQAGSPARSASAMAKSPDWLTFFGQNFQTLQFERISSAARYGNVKTHRTEESDHEHFIVCLKFIALTDF